jgi:hypothetical protein
MWVLPTYNRPERAQQTLDSLEQMGCQTPGLVYVDGAVHPAYDHLRLPRGWSLWKREVNKGVCAGLNEVFARYPNCAWYGFISDDSMVRTPSWDTKLLAKIDDYTIVHSADGWQSGDRIHGAVVFGGELLRALGWWVPPGLIHSFCDDVWESIADGALLRKFVPEVLVEHLHFWNGKTCIDRSYVKAYASFDEDRAAYIRWRETDFFSALERIRLRRNIK